MTHILEHTGPATAGLAYPGEAASAATQLMCVAPHLRRPMLPRTSRPRAGGRPSLYRVRGSKVDLLEERKRPTAVGWAFARKVLRRGNPTSTVSAAPGIDPQAIYHHCDDAIWLFRIRSLMMSAALVAAAWRWPRPTLLWLGVLVWWALPLSRTARWIVPGAGLGLALGELWAGHDGAVYWLSPGYALAIIWGVFILDALAARFMLRSIMSERGRTKLAQRRALHRQPPRLQAIVEEHNGIRVAYSGDKIVGAGEAEWTAPTAVKLAPPAQKSAPRPFTPDDLLGHIQTKLKTLRMPSGTSYAIPRLEVDAVLVAPVGHRPRAGEKPSGQAHRHIVNRHVSGEAERVYIRARAVLWDGQVVPSVYVGAVPEGEMLRFIFLPYILHPIGPELSSAQRVADSPRWLWLPISCWHALRELAAQAQSIHRAFQRIAGRVVAGMSIDPPRLLDLPSEDLQPVRTKAKPVRSLRELYADETGDMHMLDDAARFVHILRVRVYDEALAFLHEHGVDIDEFKAQVQNIINSVTVNGDVSGSGVQIIAANQASGNTNMQGQSKRPEPKKSDGKKE